jgi:hypothetical protein
LYQSLYRREPFYSTYQGKYESLYGLCMEDLLLYQRLYGK